MSKQASFLGKPAPAGYIPGIGRGATGFTTRSDIGPARDAKDVPDERHARYNKNKKEDDDENLNDNNFDEFSGYGGSLFANDKYDQEDDEADAVYEFIDQRQDEKRKEHRERRERQEVEKLRKSQPKIQQMFSDVTRELAQVTEDEWANLPEVTDIGKKVKKSRLDRFTPMPDSFLTSAVAKQGQQAELDVRQQKYGGLETPAPGTQTLMPSYTGDLDLGEIGRARTSMMSVKLDQASDSITGQTVVDPKNFLTDLNTLTPRSAGDIADVKKGRLLLASVRKSNPKHAPGWIASARLEETTGRLQAARNLVVKGTQLCPNSEDMWLEAARLLPPDQARAAVAQGVHHIPTSVRIWKKAVDLESDIKRKKRVLRRALEAAPDSVGLWKAAVDLEEPEDAKLLLSKAVVCCPASLELWLAYAHLESYENAQKVLNSARQAIPTERAIWIEASRLEEAAGHVEKVDTIITKGVETLQKKGVEINRAHWLEDAEKCDKAGSAVTAQAIVRAVVGVNVEDEDRLDTWMHDANMFIDHEAFNCARAIYAHALTLFRKDETIWLKAAFFEREHGTPESLQEHLAGATEFCPNSETLWLMAAKARWLSGDVNSARTVLKKAFEHNSESEEIWLAAVKLESENNQDERARLLLQNARKKAGTERVWMKSVRLEWVLGNLDQAKQLLSDGIKAHPRCAKLHMMAGQISEQEGNIDLARKQYSDGLRNCPQSQELWRLSATLETSQGNHVRARALLETARNKIPKCPELWLAAVRAEKAAGGEATAKSIMAKALQECPSSGLLWGEAIFMESRPQRKTKSVDALKRCENNPLVLLALARMFQSEGKVKKARDWFHRTVKLDPDLGDAWASYYKFEKKYGTAAQQEEVKKHCITAEPRHGEIWQQIAKDVKNWKTKFDELLEQAAVAVPSY